MKAMLLAAGKGTRLGTLSKKAPKVLLPVCGRPILEHNMLYLKRHGIRQVVINCHEQADILYRALRRKKFFGMEILFSYEPELLGTAGGVKQAASFLQGEDFFVLYGDNLLDFNLKDFARKHRAGKALMTLGVYQPAKTVSSGIAAGLIECRSNGSVLRFCERRSNRGVTTGQWVNAGAMMCSPEVLKEIPAGRPFDFARDLYPRLIKKGRRLNTYAGAHYVLASDTPETWRRTCRLGRKWLGAV